MDWQVHIPIMYDFWESTLFQLAKYKGNPMKIHLAFNDIKPITEVHFDTWISIWENTIRNMYAGDRAEEAIKKAIEIGQLMNYKIKNYSNGMKLLWQSFHC